MKDFKELNYQLRTVLLFLLLILFTNTAGAQAWAPLGQQGFSNGAVWFPSIAISPNHEPYVVYQDAANDDWVSVKRFDGSSWSPVGIPGFSGREVINSLIAFDKTGTPFVTFADKYYQGKASVMKFANNAWEYVGNDRFTDGQANFLSLAFDPNGIPFVAFSEYDSVMSLQVMKFENDSWINVGNTDFADHAVFNSSIKFDNNGVLYVAYVDGANAMKATVKRFDGTNWILAGGAAFSPPAANFLSLAFGANNTPFVSFASGNDSKASVMKLESNSWTDVGEKLFTTGEAYQISLIAGKDDIPSIYYTDAGFQPNVKTFLNGQWRSPKSGLFTDGIAFTASYGLDDMGFTYLAYVDNINLGGISVLKSGGVLPVSLLSFTGKVINKEVELKWTTSMETNNDRFDVLRSSDGINFKTLGTVKGKGTTTSKSNYSFIDPSPFQGMLNYYRLNQVDFDGNSYLSSIVSVKIENTSSLISIYPNPVKEVLNVKISDNDQPVTLKIFSVNGQVQWNHKYAQSLSLIQVSVSKLPAGTYHLVIEKASGEKKTMSFIKE